MHDLKVYYQVAWILEKSVISITRTPRFFFHSELEWLLRCILPGHLHIFVLT